MSYLELGGSKRFLKPVIDTFGPLPLARIDQDALDRGASKLYPNASPSTRNRQFFTPASAVLSMPPNAAGVLRRSLSARGRRRADPVDSPSMRPTPDQPRAADHLRPLVIFMLYTGARIGEALWLDWRDVDLDPGPRQLPEDKERRGPRCPAHPRV